MSLLGFLGGGVTWAMGKCPRPQGGGDPFTTWLPPSQATHLCWYVAVYGAPDLVLPAPLSYNQTRPGMVWPWTFSALLLGQSSPSWPHWFFWQLLSRDPLPFFPCLTVSPLLFEVGFFSACRSQGRWHTLQKTVLTFLRKKKIVPGFGSSLCFISS